MTCTFVHPPTLIHVFGRSPNWIGDLSAMLTHTWWSCSDYHCTIMWQYQTADVKCCIFWCCMCYNYCQALAHRVMDNSALTWWLSYSGHTQVTCDKRVYTCTCIFIKAVTFNTVWPIHVHVHVGGCYREMSLYTHVHVYTLYVCQQAK